MSFEFLDLGGDAGIRVTGRCAEEVFTQSALAVYSLMVDSSTVSAIEVVDIRVQSHSLDDLLVAWLNELIFLRDARDFIASKVEITMLDCFEFKVEAVLAGEVFDAARHKGGLLIKAATYHNLRLEKTDGKWMAEVMFDI